MKISAEKYEKEANELIPLAVVLLEMRRIMKQFAQRSRDERKSSIERRIEFLMSPPVKCDEIKMPEIMFKKDEMEKEQLREGVLPVARGTEILIDKNRLFDLRVSSEPNFYTDESGLRRSKRVKKTDNV